MVPFWLTLEKAVQVPEYLDGLVIEHLYTKGASNFISTHLKGGGWCVTRVLPSQPSPNQHFVSNLLR